MACFFEQFCLGGITPLLNSPFLSLNSPFCFCAKLPLALSCLCTLVHSLAVVAAQTFEVGREALVVPGTRQMELVAVEKDQGVSVVPEKMLGHMDWEDPGSVAGRVALVVHGIVVGKVALVENVA